MDSENSLDNNKDKVLSQVAVISRLFWLLLTPLYLINIIFGTFMVLPYWITTGTYYYESRYFKGVMAWLWKQHPNGL